MDRFLLIKSNCLGEKVILYKCDNSVLSRLQVIYGQIPGGGGLKVEFVDVRLTINCIIIDTFTTSGILCTQRRRWSSPAK